MVPYTAPVWLQLKAAAGLVRSAVPADAAVLSSSADANIRERLPLAAGKTLLAIASHWTPVA